MTSDPLISILIVNYNTSVFIEECLCSLEKLTKNSYQIFILDNGSKISDFNKLKTICSRYPNCIVDRNETDLRGSMAHGTALNILVKKVNTPYFSIIDADAIWLRKNWDEILLSQLNEKVKVIGTQAPVVGPKYQDFPLVFAILFETESFQKLNINCLPKDPIHGQDVCFELKEKYLLGGFLGKVIKSKITRTYKQGPFKDVLCSESK